MKTKLTLAIVVLLVVAMISGCIPQNGSAGATQQNGSAGTTQQNGSAGAKQDIKDSTKTDSIKRGGSITLAKTTKLSGGLNPAQSNARIEDFYVMGLIYETLFAYDEKGNLTGGLVESWEVSKDGIAITLNLRKGIKFHDGEDFNAEAVKTNLDWFLTTDAHSFAKDEIGSISEVEVISDYSVVLKLSQPDAALLSNLTTLDGFMISPKAIKELGKEGLMTKTAGTGPFMAAEYVEGDHVRLVRNPNYYKMGEDGKPLPYLDEVIIRIMTDGSVKMTNLQSGDVDIIDYHSIANNIKVAQQDDNLVTIRTDNRETFFLCYNLNNEKYKDVRVRQAIAYATDRQELMDVVLEGFGTVEAFDAAPDQWFYDDYDPYYYDPEKAKALLAEAGYPNGIDVTISIIAREPDNTMAQLLQQQLKRSNINASIEALERLAWIELIRTNRAGELGIGKIAIMGLDPNQQYNSTLVYVDPNYITEARGKLNKAKETYDLDVRKQLLAEFQKFYLDNCYNFLLGQNPRYISHNKKLQNVRIHPNGTIMLTDTWIKE